MRRRPATTVRSASWPSDSRLGAASGATLNNLFAQTQAAATALPNNANTMAQNFAFANNVSPTINLIQPGLLYGDRVNELDFKIAKILRFGGARLNAGLEIYNALNANATLTYAQTFTLTNFSGPGAWLQPTQVMTPRFFKLTAQFDF